MTQIELVPSDACPWYLNRFNVVPFGPNGHGIQCLFVDSLAEARKAKADMLTQGASEVKIYDTVDGEFYQ